MQEFQKALAYVTRRAPDGLKLLVFENRGDQNIGQARLQVPAGSIDPGESPEAGAIRELFEESGLSDLRMVGLLERYTWTGPTTGNLHHRHVYHFESDQKLPEQWDHTVTAGEDDEGHVFSFRWIPVNDASSQLIHGQGNSVRLLLKQ
jgi:8-oxo-dGTP pyrophosphatase MutT (NUDIX family)